MSYQVYKTLHFFGLIVAIAAIGAIFIQAKLNNGGKFPLKRPLMILHGIGTVIMFVAGFGLLARLGLVQGFPLWVWLKIGIWVYLGAAPSLVMRLPKLRDPLIWITPFILILAAIFAIYKPT